MINNYYFNKVIWKHSFAAIYTAFAPSLGNLYDVCDDISHFEGQLILLLRSVVKLYYCFNYNHKTAEQIKVKQLTGRSGTLEDSTPFVRKVAGSNPALAVMYGPWASPSLAIACGASA